MSMEELRGQYIIEYSYRLMIEEQFSDYTMDKIIYGRYNVLKHCYDESVCVLRHKINHIRIRIEYKSLVDYYNWREEFKKHRKAILKVNNSIISHNIFDFHYSNRNGKRDVSKDMIKNINSYIQENIVWN